jgi:hypothetical protein
MFPSDSVERLLHLPCGGEAIWDHASGIGYRCLDCNTMVGSISQPAHCVDEARKYNNWKRLGGLGWDYKLGEPEKPQLNQQLDN